MPTHHAAVLADMTRPSPVCAGHAVVYHVVGAASNSAVSSHPLLMQALQDAGLPADGPELKDMNKTRCGILIGSAMGGLQTFAQAVEDLDVKVSCQGVQRPSAGLLPSPRGQQGFYSVQCLMRGVAISGSPADLPPGCAGILKIRVSSQELHITHSVCCFVQPSIGSLQAPIQAVNTVEPNRG